MISKEDALQDLEKVQKESGENLGKLLYGIATVLVKLLVTIRSNQMLTDADKARIRAEREKKFRRPEEQK